MMPFTGGQAHATRGLDLPVIGGATFARSFVNASRSVARAGVAVPTAAARANRIIQDDLSIGGSPFVKRREPHASGAAHQRRTWAPPQGDRNTRRALRAKGFPRTWLAAQGAPRPREICYRRRLDVVPRRAPRSPLRATPRRGGGINGPRCSAIRPCGA